MQNRAIKKIGAAVLNQTFLYTLLSIFIGLLCGGIVLTITGFNPFNAYGVLANGIFGRAIYLVYDVQYATPLIFTGLAVTFAFKTGLFNIGAEGQYIMGCLVALIIGVHVNLPEPWHAILAVLCGGLAGAFLGAIAGFLKAYKGIHEVITTIMLNWIAFYFSNFCVMSPWLKKPSSTTSVDIMASARINTEAFRKTLGSAQIHWGMLLALIAVFVVWLILNKTVLGYKLRAVGFNRNGALYGGINVKGSITLSMAISGFLAGLGGACQVCGVTYRVTQLSAQENYGFNGFSVSMIGAINPIGTLFAGLFYGAMTYGGMKLNAIGAPSELVNVILGVVIYVVAIMGAFRILFAFIHREIKNAKLHKKPPMGLFPKGPGLGVKEAS
jgi:simple sugar transport system permease protein